MTRLQYHLEKQASNSNARAGVLTTRNHKVNTPIFMPVGTQATVKSLDIEDLQDVGAKILLANTYHLHLRPGPEVFRNIGGIHPFMNWGGAVLTDSGGFQIFSLSCSRTMSEEGASFRSYVDGKLIHLSPEISIETQRAINSDIMMVLDQCVPSTCSHQQAKQAMELTTRWAKRSLEARGQSDQALFGIVQGACFQDLRRQSGDAITSMPFDGFAIGGLAVGEEKHEREDFCELTANLLPSNQPRYLMGVGTPIDLLEAVHRGVDMFDCILPSSLAQQGIAFTWQGKINLRRQVYKLERGPISEECKCKVCKFYSRSYLHHLTKTKEVLGWRLIAIHNLFFYKELMDTIRQHIVDDTFQAFRLKARSELIQTDHEYPSKGPTPPRRRSKKAEVLGDFKVTQSPDGHHSIEQISSGEIMHGKRPPDEEAYELYAGQSNLQERLGRPNDDPLVVWDVGLGAGHNSLTLIKTVEAMQTKHRPIKIISFEKDLDAFTLAQQNPTRLPHMRHPAPHHLIQKGEWKTPFIHWQLIKGDFRQTHQKCEAPDLIFFDPFSTQSESEMWQEPLFRQIGEMAKDKALLLTYTAATSARASMLAAGWWVAEGCASGTRTSTTKAYWGQVETNAKLLDQRWLDRWHRSHTAIPEDLEGAQRESFCQRITDHPQFKS